MKRILLSLAVVVGAVFASAPSWAATVATVPVVGSPFTDEQKGPDGSGNIDYTFTLGATSQIFVNSSGPVSGFSGLDTTGISALSLVLLDSTNTSIGSAGSIAAFGQLFTGITQTLGAGSYTLQIFFTKASKNLFDITTTITTNLVAATPVPATGLLLLTAIGGLGGLAFRRKRADAAA